MSIIEPESGIWYALCWIVVFTRLLSRRLHLGSWRRLQLDDYLIILAMITDTILMAVMHTIMTTSSNLIAPGEDISKFSAQEIADRELGSKLVLVVEQMQLVTVWLLKACLLLMFGRMTALLPQGKIVTAVAIYVVVGFVAMEILYFAVWCRPFTQYWAVPPNNPQCSAATNHLITNAVLNISSDIMIIAIPMPLLFKVRLPLKNKVILIGVFLIGTFTIVASALNKYYSFTHPFGQEWTIWYLRESYTGILCANLPLTWPVLQRIFNLGNWSQRSYSRDQYGYGQSRSQSHTLSVFNRKDAKSRLQSHPDSENRSMQRTESQEEINKLGGGPFMGGPLKIYHNTEIDITTVEVKSPATVDTRETGRSSIDSKGTGSSTEDKTGITTTCHAV